LLVFRASKAKEIRQFLDIKMEGGEVAVYFLGASGIIAQTTGARVIFDPAGMLKSDEASETKPLDLLLFTHDHWDHCRVGATQTIFKATNSPIISQAKVAKKLEGKIPADKLVSAESGKTYNFGAVSVTAVEGIHRGPIMLYQVKMGGVTLFHGGDSGYVPLNAYPSDVAFVPVGGLSPTASPENAYKMVADIKPQVAVTMHGSEKQSKQLEENVKASTPQTSVVTLAKFSGERFRLKTKL
jgi:L-ascorbate metabolism protein UlaG (beta-lactamase superfamily)